MRARMLFNQTVLILRESERCIVIPLLCPLVLLDRLRVSRTLGRGQHNPQSLVVRVPNLPLKPATHAIGYRVGAAAAESEPLELPIIAFRIGRLHNPE